MNKIRKALTEVSCRLDLPEETLPGSLRGTFSDNRKLIIENCTGLIELEKERIVVSGGKGKLAVYGSELVISAMSNETVYITGKISSVEWE